MRLSYGVPEQTSSARPALGAAEADQAGGEAVDGLENVGPLRLRRIDQREGSPLPATRQSERGAGIVLAARDPGATGVPIDQHDSKADHAAGNYCHLRKLGQFNL